VTRVERLQDCINQLMAATAYLELVSVEYQHLADSAKSPRNNLNDIRYEEHLAISRTHTISFAVVFRSVERVIRFIGYNLPESKSEQFETDIRTLKSKVVRHYAAPDWNKKTIAEFRILVSDFYANWQSHLSMIDKSNPLQDLADSNSASFAVQDRDETPKGLQSEDVIASNDQAKPFFQRYGPVIVMYGEKIELTKQSAILLVGILSRPSGLSFDDVRKLLNLPTESPSGIQTRLANLKNKLATATESFTFKVFIHTECQVIMHNVVRQQPHPPN